MNSVFTTASASTATFPAPFANSPNTNNGEPRPKVRRNTASAGDANIKIKPEQRPNGTFAGHSSNSRRLKPSLDIPENKPTVFQGNSHHPYSTFSPMHQTTQSSTHYGKPIIASGVTTPSLVGLSIESPFTTQAPVSALTYNQLQQQHQIRQSHNIVPNGPPSTFSMNVPAASHAPVGNHFTAHQGLPPFSLPPQSYPAMTHISSGMPVFGLTSPPTSSGSNEAHASVAAPTGVIDQASMDSMQTSMPVFGGDTYKRSPFTITDDFAAWLFGDPTFQFSQAQSANFMERGSMAGAGLYMDQDMSGHHFFPGFPHHPMSVTSIIAPPSPPQESQLSENKRQELVDIIETYPEAATKFRNNLHSSIVGNVSLDESGVLSLQSMQLFIQLFWQHFHPQLPILHKPTFSADKTPNLLLLSILAMGASCVDRKQDPLLAQSAADLSNTIAMNLRWQIFDNVDFRPPAKLWVFQALLILETFEKMYATRQLHERAHIHHATTLTLMRRGSSLQGRCALDSPPSVRDERPGHGPGQSSGSSTPDERWNHWVMSEATKRCAFAAFVLDSVHATMFGHSAIMVAHEMRLALPCDETLWAAGSAAEVARIEQNLVNQGVKSINFLEGLKRTLGGQSVRANSFGRTVIMAGLLSVAWHMNQRDLQVSSLGATHALGGRDKWRSALTRAFDFWKMDFDKSIQKGPSTTSASAYDGIDYFLPNTEDVEVENVSETRTVLHHLAHMTMHVDIVDLQIYAGARRLLGRSIGGSDSRNAQRRLKEWAMTARARDATFYALRFLKKVLEPAEGSQGSYMMDENGVQRRVIKPRVDDEAAPLAYSARDDFLLNRPWVLYFAMLIVWAYGFALDGTVDPTKYVLTTEADTYKDMRRYLRRMGGVKSPEELATQINRNRNLGLLHVLKKQFGEMRWELLREANTLLSQCIEISTGKLATGG